MSKEEAGIMEHLKTNKHEKSGSLEAKYKKCRVAQDFCTALYEKNKK